ncbi:MAE_28990/MAE_18760 family HEPN-like nuclease [Aurantimonas sp. Leaf443]|uniref:MAE_28990/MAE_18760 family HEPN-like nuclease n=1 Tax=Aurantimonas sp. Leaf443 TaxID=1736378 RepID=UPI0006F22C9C|nr:MAE_28990/MAE_18760 family HEPN-like nuclease [Aurantimonas sp. Leaf443]KQT83115.1 hypothetical protein ASG48_14175 [Aurantimonas sp. Leaf443]
MTPARRSLLERREQFDIHFSLAQAVQTQIFEGETSSLGELELTVRHLLTIKSGLVVHIYNVLESTMTGVMDVVGRAIGSAPPTEWTEDALKEWLRKHAASASDGGEEGRLRIVHTAARHLLGTVSPESRTLKKPSGSWSDELVYTFARRLRVQVTMPPDMHRRLQKRADLRGMTPVEFVADRRNAIAHGRRSFEDGANDITLQSIRELADVTLDFLGHAVDAFEDYIAAERYRIVT